MYRKQEVNVYCAMGEMFGRLHTCTIMIKMFTFTCMILIKMFIHAESFIEEVEEEQLLDINNQSFGE